MGVVSTGSGAIDRITLPSTLKVHFHLVPRLLPRPPSRPQPRGYEPASEQVHQVSIKMPRGVTRAAVSTSEDKHALHHSTKLVTSVPSAGPVLLGH